MTVATLVADLDVVGLVQDVADAIAPYGARDRVLPPEIGQHSVQRRGVMTTACMRVMAWPGVGDVRTLAVVGDEVLALQVIAMPRADRDVGMFRAEAVVARGEPFATLDIQALEGSRDAEAMTARVARRAESCLAQHPREQALERFGDLLGSVWSLHVYDMVLAAELSRVDADRHFAEMLRWKEARVEDTSMRAVLQEAFGIDWTERALDRHFFG